MWYRRGLMLVFGALLLVGCATITKTSSQSIAITSNVDGARLYLDGVQVGSTPFNGTVPKNKKEIKIEKEGYRTETIVLSKTLEGMFWGNIILGGTIGSITDFATGAAYAYAPATYQIDLKSNDQTAADFEHEYVARRFSMVYVNEISRDLGASGGEHLTALCELMGAQANDPTTTTAIRGALQSSSGDAVAFGNAIVALL